MATLPTYFSDFLQEIRPTANQRDDLKTGHETLRKRLREYYGSTNLIVGDFLQGSYKRSTVVRPKNGDKSDVDIILVTRISKDEHTPRETMAYFVPFLEKHYKDKWRQQGRSFGIKLSYVELDLVITAAPSESQLGILTAKAITTDEGLEEEPDLRLAKGWVPMAERGRLSYSDIAIFRKALSEPEWKTEPLWIPDHDANEWDKTHPLAQITWARDKNKACNSYYLGVVQALKWWRRGFDDPDRPKGYPVEHLIGLCCPDGIGSVAEGVTLSLEQIALDYAFSALRKQVPFLPDHGVPEHNVMGRVSGDDFAGFYAKVVEAAKIAREAYDEPDVAKSAQRWRDLFGAKFPEPPPATKQGGFSDRERVTVVGGTRFA